MALFAWKGSDTKTLSHLKHTKKEHHEDHEKLKSLEMKISHLTHKMDTLLTKFEKMDKRINEIEFKINGDQKQNGDGFKEEVLKEMKSMKQEIQKLTLSNVNTEEQQQLKGWLENTVGLPQYFDVFIANGIEDISTASDLKMEQLKAMGIDVIGHQMKILNQVLKLKQNDNDKNC